MIKVLFVCTGNICRSPTAHGVFRDKVAALGLSDTFFCDSAGTHGYHVGALPDRRSMTIARENGYDLTDIRARQVTYDDFGDFDVIYCMDAGHKLTLERAAPKEHHDKIQMFDDHDVGDPYYGENGFETVLRQIENACDQIISKLQSRA